MRERIQGAAVELSWIPALQRDTRTRNVHASTAIEGNPLILEQVRAPEEGRPLVAKDQRSEREVLNCFAGLRYVEKHAGKKAFSHEDVLRLHRILAEGLRQTLERVWLRVQAFGLGSPEKLVLRPKQERLLQLLRDHSSMSPPEIWAALGVSRQGAMDLLRPLLDAGMVEKIGTRKTGRYALRRP